MDFNYKCGIELFFDSKKESLMVANSVLPDLNSSHYKRSKTKIKVNKNVLSLNIKASDPVALRASLNGCLKLISLAQKISEVE